MEKRATFLVAVLCLIMIGCNGTKTQHLTLTLAGTAPCGNVTTNFAPNAGTTAPTVGTTTGPAGPVAVAVPGGIKYSGNLTNGNEFGTCQVFITGTFPGSANKWKSWDAKGTIAIGGPGSITFQKPAIELGMLGIGSVIMTVAPPCKYKVVLTQPSDPIGFKFGPASVVTTDSNGTITISVEDTYGRPRGPVTITATITPIAGKGKCQGGTPVTGTFTVKVL